jgi:FtsH-binding integral membrane protein
MYDFSVIKKSQSFVELLDAQSQTKYVFLFGFMLFMNLIQLLWIVIRIMISIRR